MNENDARLAEHVTLNLSNWRVGDGCPAWIESREDKCGKDPARGYLCNRHHNIAIKRQGKALDEARARATTAAEIRAVQLPVWKQNLAAIEDEIERLDRPVVRDRAAFGGATNKSIEKKRMAGLSDAKVQRMALLARKAEMLRRKIGED